MGKKRRIIIVGLHLFAQRLSEELRSRMKNWEVIHLDTYASKIDQLRGLFLIPNADVVYSINGTLDTSKVFDLALKKNVGCIMHWVGTDVLKATKAFNEGRYKKEFVEKITHFCEVNWIQEELKQINIDAKIVNFASFDKVFDSVIPKSNRLKLLSYMSDARAEFYGLQKVIDLANVFPEIDFTIVGATADSFKHLPENMKALGWINDMDAQFDNCHATIRVPEHDGLSNFVLESLARGKQVFYNHPYENCIFCPSQIDLQNGIREMLNKFSRGECLSNEKGKITVEKEFNADFVFSRLINEINLKVEK